MNTKTGFGLAAAISMILLGFGYSNAQAATAINACVNKYTGQIAIPAMRINGPQCSWDETPISLQPAVPSVDAFLKDQIDNFAAQALDGSTFIEIIKVTLPIGSYVVNAVANVAGPLAFSIVECELSGSVSGALSSSSKALVGGTSNSFGTIPVTTAFTLTAAEDISLGCRATGTNVLSQPSTMTVIRVGTLTEQ
jgi:hypothetical protein